MPSIKLQNVYRKLNEYVILRDINLEIPDNTLYSIIGPPRSGKTVLGRIIGGLEVPDRGRVFFDDKDVTYLNPVARNVAIVFQDFALYPHLTAFENISSPLVKLKVSKGEIEKRVLEIAEYLKISHRLSHYPSELSGGERQRVAIARALAKAAQTIILDEPFLRLDYKVREELRVQLYRLQKELGVNIILLSSDPFDAMSFPRNIAFMKDGEILQIGDFDQLFERPVNIHVASYLGIIGINLLSGKLVIDGCETYLDTDIGKIVLNKVPKFLKDKVLIGIRPEFIHYKVEDVPSVNTVFTIRGKINFTEIMGSETIIHLDVGLAQSFKILIPTIFKKTRGEMLEVAFNLRDLYFFDVDGKFICRGVDVFGQDTA